MWNFDDLVFFSLCVTFACSPYQKLPASVELVANSLSMRADGSFLFLRAQTVINKCSESPITKQDKKLSLKIDLAN